MGLPVWKEEECAIGSNAVWLWTMRTMHMLPPLKVDITNTWPWDKKGSLLIESLRPASRLAASHLPGLPAGCVPGLAQSIRVRLPGAYAPVTRFVVYDFKHWASVQNRDRNILPLDALK